MRIDVRPIASKAQGIRLLTQPATSRCNIGGNTATAESSASRRASSGDQHKGAYCSASHARACRRLIQNQGWSFCTCPVAIIESIIAIEIARSRWAQAQLSTSAAVTGRSAGAQVAGVGVSAGSCASIAAARRMSSPANFAVARA